MTAIPLGVPRRLVEFTLDGQQARVPEGATVLDACRERDAERAGQLVFDHIMGACRSLLEHLPRIRTR